MCVFVCIEGGGFWVFVVLGILLWYFNSDIKSRCFKGNCGWDIFLCGNGKLLVNDIYFFMLFNRW